MTNSAFDSIVLLLEKYRVQNKEFRMVNADLKKRVDQLVAENQRLKQDNQLLRAAFEPALISGRALPEFITDAGFGNGSAPPTPADDPPPSPVNSLLFEPIEPEPGPGNNQLLTSDKVLIIDATDSIAADVKSRRRKSSKLARKKVKKLAKTISEEEEYNSSVDEDPDFEVSDIDDWNMMAESEMTRYHFEKTDDFWLCPWPECGHQHKRRDAMIQHYLDHQDPNRVVERKRRQKENKKSTNPAKLPQKIWDRIVDVDSCWICPECEFMAEDRMETARHYRNTHMRLHHCHYPGCGYTSTYRHNLENHIRGRHRQERPFKCSWPGCDVSKKFQKSLREHMITHTGDYPLACDWPGCEFKTVKKNQLAQHVRSCHTGERPFECPFENCQETFISRQQLRDHRKRKHEEAPRETRFWSCPWPGCENKYRSNKGMQIHLKRHSDTDERPFACDHPGCEKRFFNQATLGKHKTHHFGRRFFCQHPGCGKNWVQMKEVKRHYKFFGHTDYKDEMRGKLVKMGEVQESGRENRTEAEKKGEEASKQQRQFMHMMEMSRRVTCSFNELENPVVAGMPFQHEICHL